MRLYIAHNLHFYTTLLVVFLRVMTKVNLTACSDGQKNLLLLGRVLEVFTKEVVDIIRQLSEGFVHWLERALPVPHTSSKSAVLNTIDPTNGEAQRNGGRVRFVPVEHVAAGHNHHTASGSTSASKEWRTPSRSTSGISVTGPMITNEEIKLMKQHVRFFF